MIRSFLIMVSAAALLFLTQTEARAQAGSAELTGQVVASAGAALANAGVIATDMQAGVVTRASSSAAGLYVFNNLRPGQYSVSVEATGFQTFVQKGVTLTTGERVRVDVKMAVGDVKENITVSADVPLLQTESGSITQSIDHDKVVDLPLNGRTFVQLATLSPGVMLPPGTLLPRINGGRPRTNEYLFDGISALQPEPGQVALFPIIDAIQEFNIQTNGVSAEFGRFNGGVINLTTRAGSNEFHGSMWEFFRNEALNSRNYFARPPQKKPEFRRNQYGAAIGGPIIRNRTFFFVDYQGVKQAIGTVRTSTVPTLWNGRELHGTVWRHDGGFVRSRYDRAGRTSFSRSPFSPTNVIQSTD